MRIWLKKWFYSVLFLDGDYNLQRVELSATSRLNAMECARRQHNAIAIVNAHRLYDASIIKDVIDLGVNH